MHFIVQPSLLWCTAELVTSSRASSPLCPLLLAFNNLYFQCHLCRHMEALIALRDLTIHQGRSTGLCPINRTRPHHIFKKCSAMVRTLPLFPSSRCQAAPCAGILLFYRCFLFSLPFFFDSGCIEYWRGCLGTQALCKKKLIWKCTDQWWWAVSAD